MNPEEFLKSLQGKNQQEILLETTLSYLSRLPSELEDAAYKGAILRWFNAEVLEELRDVGVLSDRERVSADSVIPTEQLYKQLHEMPFSEEYPDRGYSFHELTRKVILEYLWQKEPDFYRQVSTRAQQYFQSLLETQINQSESGEIDQSEIDLDIIVEIAYHYVTTNEEEAVAEIEAFLEDLIQQRQLGVYHAVLQAVTEHATAGRMSPPNQARVIELWRLREAYETYDIKRLEEIAQGLLKTSDISVTPQLEADATYLLADGLRLASRYDDAYQYFEKNVRQNEALGDPDGMLDAISGLGQVEYDRENFELAINHFTEALFLRVQQLRLPASEDSEFGDDTPLRVFYPEAWHRQELYPADNSQDQGEDTISPESDDADSQKAIILYFVEIDVDELDIDMTDSSQDEIPVPQWPVDIDGFLANLWLNLGYIHQAIDKFDIAAASGRLAGEIFMDLGDLSGAQSAVQLLQSLGASIGDLAYVKQTRVFQHDLLSEAAAQGDQRALLVGLMNQARSSHNESRYDEAQAKYKEAYSVAESLDLANDKATCLDGLARLNWIDGNYDDAEKQFKTAIELYEQVQNKGGKAWALLSLGDLNVDRHRISDAEDNYFSVSETYKELRIFSGRIDSLLRLSDVTKIQGKYEESFTYLDCALALSRKEKRLSSEARVLSEIGKLYLSLGNYDKAQETYNHAFDISKRIRKQELTIDILLDRAQVLSEMAEYTEAVKIFDQVIEIDPDNHRAYSGKGWALQCLGKKHAVEARQAYESASKLVPKDWWIHKGIANALRLEGHKEAANTQYQWVVDQIKNDVKPSMLSALAWSYYHQGEYQKAKNLYREVVESELVEGSDYFDLGLTLVCLKGWSEALRVYKQGLKLLNQKYPVRCRLGLIDVAIFDLQESIEENPQFANVKQCIEIQGLLRKEWEFVSTTSLGEI